MCRGRRRQKVKTVFIGELKGNKSGNVVVVVRMLLKCIKQIRDY